MKRGTIDHPKTYELARYFNRPRRDMVGLLEMLFHFTAQYAPQGDIGRYSDKRIAAALDWQGDPSRLVGGLLACGWLDADDRHRLVTHDWADHLDQGVKKKLERAKLQVVELSGKVSGQHPDMSTTEYLPALPEPVPEPVPEPLKLSIPDTQERSSGLDRKTAEPDLRARANGRFANWLEAWPRVPNPDTAARAWLSVVGTNAAENGAFASRDRYLQSDEAARNVLMDPAKFLFDQSACGWAGKWPTRAPPTQRSLTPTEQAIQEAKQRAKRTN